MAKTKISEFSATPANNTDIDNINIAEGCAPSGINDAIRELMSQLKDFQTGAVGDSFNGPVGAITASTGNFTTLTTTSGKIGPNDTQQHTMPAVTSDTYTLNAATQTLTNKRINSRAVIAAATSGSLTINGDTTDLYKAEGLVGAITFLTPSGTPVDGQKLVIRIEDNGVARGITWTVTSGAFRAVGVTLPTTTTASKVTYVGCLYNSTDIFWDVVAVTTQA